MKFTTKLCSAAVLSGLAFAGTSAFAQATYTLTDVGALPGCTAAYASGLNELGHVVGQCHNGVGFSRAFVARNGAVTALGNLPEGTYSEAAAINDNGAIVGQGDSGSAVMLGWVKTTGGLTNYFSNKGGFTRSMFIGNSGFIGGRYTTSNSGWVASIKGAIWVADPKDPRKFRKTDLPILAGGVDPKSSYSHPNAFNHEGFAVGYGETDQMYRTAVVWNNNAARTISTLPLLEDGYGSEAYAISGDGRIAGVNFGAAMLPVVWSNDAARTPTALALPSGDTWGQANAINNAGHVIGTTSASTPGLETPNMRQVIWRDGGVFTMQDLLDAATGAGYTITSLVAINNAGQIIANATLNGQAKAVVLTPAVQ